MKASEIRKKFAEFFEKSGHDKHQSSPLIPQNDPTLLFANAGMNQFKDYFTGKAQPKNRRATTIQKCVRAGGKHNDLENVGMTARHHTFFEMLGNFSFGDYFKSEAISYAWKFLTEELKIPAEKLFITVHHSDDEAFEIWNKEIGIPAEKIFRKGDKDNFWEMGEYGPCGPCSEIFYDHGETHTTPNFTPGEGQDLLDDEMRYVEIWNLVFMQFEKTKEGKFPLPKPSIDTGAGLERIAAALQGKYWNYDTDLFTPIISELEKISGKKYTNEKYTTSMRVVADHARSCTMLITDGVIPSNDGRGYVLRRIIRRAVRHLKEIGAPQGSFHKLVPIVFSILGEEYPQNENNAALAEKLLKLEETRFLETLDQGIKFLDEAIEKEITSDKTLPGESVFKLYDTYGFPVDLTEIILTERGLKADMDEFQKVMKKRKEESKKSWKGGIGTDNKIFHEAKQKHGATQFKGYETNTSSAKLLAKLPLGEQTGLVFDQTPFYGESGGQVGDKGTVLEGTSVICNINDTQKPVDDLFVHLSTDADGLEVGNTYTITINDKQRELTKRNHSATHLLQSALIEVLGDHVKQAGSIVTPEKLRFDFTHPQAMTKDELTRVEERVNRAIEDSLPVSIHQMTQKEAMAKGALALFGEKYGDEVRVLEMGDFSVELCGGTHVNNTSDIGFFAITTETSLSTGVRRIEAQTSTTAINRLQERSNILAQIEKLINTNAKNSLIRVEALLKEQKESLKTINELKDKLQAKDSDSLFDNLENINGDISFVATEAPEGSDLRKISDIFVSKHKRGIIFIYTKKGPKAATLLRRSKDLDEFNCSQILNLALKELNGKGGGKPDMAQGSGDWGNTKAAIDIIKNQLKG